MNQKENLVKKLAVNAEKLAKLIERKENIESEIVRLEKKIQMQKATLQILNAKEEKAQVSPEN
jgi:phage shock protein A